MNKTKLEKGITLIALVITIIVLLILAGVSIAMLTGENGILNRAILAREEASHGEVREQVLLAIAEYELEKKTPEGSEAETIIDYLGQNGYLTEYDSENPKESYVIPKAKLGEATLGKGTSKETGDVYVIEKGKQFVANTTRLATTQQVNIKDNLQIATMTEVNQNWILKYYKTSENSKELLTFLTSETKDMISFNLRDTYHDYVESFKCERGMTFHQFLKTGACDTFLDGIFSMEGCSDVENLGTNIDYFLDEFSDYWFFINRNIYDDVITSFCLSRTRLR